MFIISLRVQKKYAIEILHISMWNNVHIWKAVFLLVQRLCSIVSSQADYDEKVKIFFCLFGCRDFSFKYKIIKGIHLHFTEPRTD